MYRCPFRNTARVQGAITFLLAVRQPPEVVLASVFPEHPTHFSERSYSMNSTESVTSVVRQLLGLLQYDFDDREAGVVLASKDTPTGPSTVSILCLEDLPDDLLGRLEDQGGTVNWVVVSDNSCATDDHRAAASLMSAELMTLTQFLDRTFRAPQIAQRLYQQQHLVDISNAYVPQRVLDDTGPVSEDSVDFLSSYCRSNQASLLVVLAPAGYGKTWLTSAYARSAARAYVDCATRGAADARLPFLVPFSEYRRLSSFSGIIRERLQALGIPEYTSDAFKFLLNRGRLTLILDGFDELLESSPKLAQDNLREIVQHVAGRGLLVLTSRTTFFATRDEVTTFLSGGLAPETIRVVSLDGFDESRQRQFLVKNGATDQQANQAIRMGTFAELAQTPQNLAYLLEMIKDDPSAADRVRSARDVFDRVFSRAFARERDRQKYQYTDEQQQAFLRDLAFSLWRYGDNAMTRDHVMICTPGDEKAELLLGHHLLRPTPSGQITFQHHRVRDFFIAAEIDRIMRHAPERIPEVFSKRMPEGAVVFLGEVVTYQRLADAWERCGRSPVARGNLIALLLERNRLEGDTDRAARTSHLQSVVGQVEIRDADLSRLRLEMLDLRSWRFVSCNLSGTAFLLCDIRGFTRQECHESGVKFEECISEIPIPVAAREAVVNDIRSQVSMFIIDASRHMWRDKIAENDVRRSGRYIPEVVDALRRRGLLGREQGEKGAWFIRLLDGDGLKAFWAGGQPSDAIEDVIRDLLRRRH
jgi:hypothetical protein